MINRNQQPQIVVIDDETEKEALPLLKALFKIGKSVLYYTSRPSDLPDQPLTGIRLLFLDLRLGLAGTSTRANVTAAASVVRKLMSPDNGPYILVAWTKHLNEMPELLPLLHIQPTAFIALDKRGCITNDGECELSKVMAEVQAKLSQNGPVELLLFWECLVANASASTVNQICKWATDAPSVESILYQIAAAGLGDHIQKSTEVQRARATLDVLNSLLSDSIETSLNDSSLNSFKPLNQVGTTTKESVSKLNAKLLIGQVTDENPYPGNVYKEFQAKRRNKTKIFLKERVPMEAIRKHVKPQVNETHKTVISRLSPTEREALFEKEAVKFQKKLINDCLYVFIEITPVCDHAQAAWKNHRIIPGILLKNDFSKLIYKGQNDIGFLVCDILFLPQYDGIYVLILDFRGLETMDIGCLVGKKPMFRLRQDFLFDIQHRAGSHFSRPGIVSLR